MAWIIVRRLLMHGWETRGERNPWRFAAVLQFASILAILTGGLLYHFPLGGPQNVGYKHMETWIWIDFNVGKYLFWPGIAFLTVSVILDFIRTNSMENEKG